MKGRERRESMNDGKSGRDARQYSIAKTITTDYGIPVQKSLHPIKTANLFVRNYSSMGTRCGSCVLPVLVDE